MNRTVPVHSSVPKPTPKGKKNKNEPSLLSLSSRCSGCCAGEPGPLASALRHLRCLGGGGGPVIHTQRHQLAAPPDSLPLQCKSCPHQVVIYFVITAGCPAPPGHSAIVLAAVSMFAPTRPASRSLYSCELDSLCLSNMCM